MFLTLVHTPPPLCPLVHGVHIPPSAEEAQKAEEPAAHGEARHAIRPISPWFVLGSLMSGPPLVSYLRHQTTLELRPEVLQTSGTLTGSLTLTNYILLER